MRVTVVDDSVIAREGLRRLLEQEGHAVETLDRADRALAAVQLTRPDAAILDVRMPPTFTDEGVRLAKQLQEVTPGLAILVLSQYAVPEYATKLLECNASGVGYLLKDRIFEPLQLSQALHRLSAGGTVVDPDVVGDLISSRRTHDALGRLTAREREVLQYMAQGMSDRGISEHLFVSPNTVGTHIQHIFRKLALPDSPTSNRRVLAVLQFLNK